MAKRRLKTKSKRVTCHKRYKILKKVREHHRQLRKEAKSHLNKTRRKDPGVPNTLPFKEAIFKHAEEVKQKAEEVRLFNLLNAGKVNSAEKSAPPLSVSLIREANQVITEADVIVEVLDARDPLGTRCFDIEKQILSSNKRLVLVINKIDLVPRANLQRWLNYLRDGMTVLPFKANTQQQSKNLSRGKILWNLEQRGPKNRSVKGMGAEDLMSLLANYCRTNGSKIQNNDRVGCLTVGVIGFPNTGKSALINTLKRQKVCASCNVPGTTHQSQRVRLDKNIFLLDSPGIVTSNSTDPSELVLKNCLRPESLPDPVPAVEAILRRCPKQQLMTKYDIDDYSDTTSFLVQVAQRLGRLKKGGLPNTTMAARSVINDWITGKITYTTEPPECLSDANVALAEERPSEVLHEEPMQTVDGPVD
ncbi:unnamed protein product [Calicophoron daubneyi]|uniref:CP-type G domain-containing protein n=1 Tax=Calicophoron daubneyi TaxID=300641 RepID=A0AAV2SXG3_CALDB